MSLRYGISRFLSSVCVCMICMFGAIGNAWAVDYKFSITTTPLSVGDSFSFIITARGTFYVDCGGGGTLTSDAETNDVTGNPVTGFTIDRSNIVYSEDIDMWGDTSYYSTYTCTYNNVVSSSKTVQFGGIATGYNGRYHGYHSAIIFSGNTKIKSVSGNMSVVFPFVDSDEPGVSNRPSFEGAFANCTNLESINGALFGDYTEAIGLVFANVFKGCTSLTYISEDLFLNMRSVKNSVFEHAFDGCTSLTELPQRLFANITELNGIGPDGIVETGDFGAGRSFECVFKDCTNLQGYIPPTLFAGIIPRHSLYPNDEFIGAFENTQLWTSCEAHGMCEYQTGWNSSANGGWGRPSCKPCVTLTYDCGNGIFGGENSYTEGVTVNITPTSANCTVPENAEFAGWYCSYGHNDVNLSSVVSVANLINGTSQVRDLYVDSGQTFSFAIQSDTLCTAIWRGVQPCADNETLTTYVLGQPESESTINFEATSNGNNCGSGCVSLYYGNVHVEGMCSTTAGTPYYAGNPTNTGNSGRYCWCRVTQFDPVEGEAVTFAEGESNWIYLGEGASGDHSRCGCQDYCESAVAIDSFADFRQSLYTTYQCAPNYNVTYDCNKPGTNVDPVVESYAVGTEINVTPASAGGCGVSSEYSRNDPEFIGWYCSWGNNLNTVSLFSVDGVDNSSVSVYPNSVGIGQNVNFELQHDTLCVGIWRKSTSCPTGQVMTTFVLGGPASDFDQSWWNDVAVIGSPASHFSYGDVSIEGKCCSTLGVPGQPGNPTPTTGSGYCWCRVTQFDPVGGESITFFDGESNWVYTGELCGIGCGGVCEEYLSNNNDTNLADSPEAILFHKSLYTIKQCVVPHEYEFWVHTPTTLSTNAEFKFTISAKGTFYVDCDTNGNDGILTGTGVSGSAVAGWTIDRTNNTNNDTYTCTYSSGGEKVIGFGGDATGYNSNIDIAAIKFTTTQYVKSLEGDLSAIFGYIGSSNNEFPRFYGTFSGCTNLTSLPNTLFDSLTSGGEKMFSRTFTNSGLTAIPSDLFQHVTTGAVDMFEYAFASCGALAAIPNDLFQHITTSAAGMFAYTFTSCNGLVNIPSGLFSFGGNNVSGAPNMFAGTFARCVGLQETYDDEDVIDAIPGTLFSHVTSGAERMFFHTFENCLLLTSVPENLFQSIVVSSSDLVSSSSLFENTFSSTGLVSIPEDLFDNITPNALSTDVFKETFANCTGLRYLPVRLFDHITTAVSGMFNGTFSGCSGLEPRPGAALPSVKYNFIPKALFGGLINANNPDQTPQAQNMMKHVFQDTTLRTCCPQGFGQFITGYEGSLDSNGYKGWDSYVSCDTCPEGTSSVEDTDLGSGCWKCVANETFTVTYSCGDGATGTAPVDSDSPYTSGQTATILPNGEDNCTYEGYTFNGWDCGAADEEIEITDNMTCTAQWEAIPTFTVIYDCNNGISTENQTNTYATNTTVDVPASNVNCTVPTGYSFIGWYCSWGENNITLSVANAEPYTPIMVLDNHVFDVLDVFHPQAVLTGSFEIQHDTLCMAIWQAMTIPCNDNETLTTFILGVPSDDPNVEDVSIDANSGLPGQQIRFNSDSNNSGSPIEYQIRYETMASSTPGIVNVAGNPSIESGNNCWCRVTQYDQNGTGDFQVLNDMPWVFSGIGSDYNYCVDSCSKAFIQRQLFRIAAYTTQQCVANETYTVTYSCGENATGDAPVDSNSPYNYGINATILSNTDADTGEDYCTYDGYTFSGWDCGAVGEFLSMTHDYTCEARWEQNETYTVTYSCGENASGTAPVDDGTYTSGQTATILSNGEDNCIYDGYTFNGWDCGTVGEGIEITGNVTCTAQWQRDYEFWVDTMSLNSGDNFKFKISARGTFYVNCGENGTLSGNGDVSQDSLGGANGYVINRTSNTSNDTYICNYSSGGEKTIAFAGDATGYGSGINVPATTFDTETGHINAQKVNAIRGDLSAVFGYIGSSNSEYPRFIGTFQNCRNLTSIPNTLFASLTNSGEYMFGMTFKNCVGLVSTNANNNQPIPGDLFNFGGNNVSGAESMFKSTFEGCNGLTSIPENLFSHINGSANKLFSATFMDCTNLTSIPGNLFNFGGNNVSGAEYMFYQTFENCAGLTTIQENLFAHISSSAQYMFANAFAGCSSLVSIPENLFAFSGSSVIPGGRYMFQGTFKNCVGLTSIPEGLFVHVMVPSSSSLPVGMFNMTFYGCTGLKYLPKNLFSHITNPAQNLFQETFKNCTGFENYTDSNGEMRWRFIPSTLFNGLINENDPETSLWDSNMMLNIFNGDTTLYTCCPAGFEEFNVGFRYANWWYPSVSCAACPEGTTAAEILEGSGCYECLEPGEQAGGIRIATSNMSSGDTFDFDLSAAGTFYVDCGVDGRLVSTTDDVTPGEVTGWVIRRNNTDNATYRCSYSSRGEKMVRFSGRATAYNGKVVTGSNGEMTAVPAISFEPARERLVSVDGDLSKMFPILGQSDTKIPRFYRTFANCVSLEKISGKLFRRYTSGTTLMFGSTFAGCRSLKEIPGNLFSNIVKGADQMFVQTFSGCERLEGFIAPNLFAGLIANHSPYSKDMMRGIFDETSLATRCPEKYSQYITGYERYWDRHVSCEPMQTYNVVYDCGGGLGRAPASKEIRVGEVFIAANNTCTPPRDDMVFAGWEVSGTDDVSREESSTEWGYRESKTLTAKWAPNSEFECKSGKYLHIGEDQMCLSIEDDVEKPALAIGGKGHETHYLQMTIQNMNSEPLPINDKSSKKLNILYKGDLYNVHDGSVGK